MWYKQPAANWNEALPLGNGRLAAMIFGGTLVDRYSMNEDSVWYGGPRDRINPDALPNLEKIRKHIIAGELKQATSLLETAFAPIPEFMRNYQPLCEFIIQQMNGDRRTPEILSLRELQTQGRDMRRYEFEPCANYTRTLDLDTGIHTTKYEIAGEKFERESFISYPAQVMAVRVKGGEARAFMRRERYAEVLTKLDQKTIAMKGQAGETGVHYAAAVRVVANDVHAYGDTLLWSGDATIYFAGATTYRQEDPLAYCVNLVNEAEKKGYDALKAEHVADFSSIMRRCELTIDSDEKKNALTTAERLEGVRNGATDTGLINEYFKFGRYLLASSSRPGSLPANLQGKWNELFTPPWDSKYTININAEMNYWLAESCNLSEMHMPLIELIRTMRKSGGEVAKRMYGARGFMAHHNTDIWGDCAPMDICLTASFWQMGAAWMCLHIWEHFLYTRDLAFLEANYDLLSDAALFFKDALIEDDKGRLVCCPTISPENRYILPDGTDTPLCCGATMDSQILTALFEAVVEGGKALGKDASEYQDYIEMSARLPETRIGKKGTIMEWPEDYEEVDPGHRHISHLFGLIPGWHITESKTPELAKAARATLERRLANGGGHTGWSRAWIINMWARLMDGEKSGENVDAILAKSTMISLLDDHPPFQIDGNFGATAGIAEMLMQSHEGFVRLLPALPSSWKNGTVKGLVARGGVDVDVSWKDGRLTHATLTAKRDQAVRVKVVDGVKPSKAYELVGDCWLFDMKAGDKVSIG